MSVDLPTKNTTHFISITQCPLKTKDTLKQFEHTNHPSKNEPLGGLVGEFNPFEKYARQIGSFPQVGGKIKNIWNHQPKAIPFNRKAMWFPLFQTSAVSCFDNFPTFHSQ